MEEEKQGRSIPVSRRDFLKVSGAAAGAAVAVGATRRPILQSLEEIIPGTKLAQANEQLFKCVCRPNCNGYCPIYVHVRGGKVVATSMRPHADPKYNRICLRGLSHVQRIYSPERVKYPMKRAGNRGEGKWERISWDEAINTITDQWKHIQEQYGKQAVAFATASGNLTLLGALPGATGRLQNLIQGTTLQMDVDAAISHGINRVLGPLSLRSNEDADVIHAKTMIAWGVNLTVSMLHSWHFVADAIENGTKLIVIDPVFTDLAAKAHEYFSVRPGSDPALILSMMQVIISENLHNVDFLLAHTVAPFLVRDDTKLFLRMSDLGVAPTDGPADATGKPTKIDPPVVWDSATAAAVAAGTVTSPALDGAYVVQGVKVRTAFDLLKEEVNQYPPEVASKITEVDSETIKHLARVAAEPPVFHHMGMGPQAYSNGVHVGHAAAALAAITGNLGFPGASVGYNWTFYPGINWAFTFPNMTFGSPVPSLAYRKVAKSGKYQGKPYPVKALYVAYGNPANTAPNTNEWVNDVMPTLDLVVVADSVLTDTARYADIVLPVADWFEHEDIVSGGQTQYIEFSEKAIEPLYESKTDTDIYRLLADKMGVGEFFKKTDRELMAEAMDTPVSKQLGITVDTLAEKSMVRYMKDPLIAYEGNQFFTPSGRAEFYVEKPTPREVTDEKPDLDRERLPRFFPPTEAWPENPLHEKYPLVLLSERPKFRAHSQWFSTPWLRELDPEPIVKINAKDALARGIRNGDYVEVFNDRGNAVVKAVVTQGVRPGAMVFPKGWQHHQYKAGDLSTLASSAFDPVGVNASFMDELVEVRKWNGEV